VQDNRIEFGAPAYYPLMRQAIALGTAAVAATLVLAGILIGPPGSDPLIGMPDPIPAPAPVERAGAPTETTETSRAAAQPACVGVPDTGIFADLDDEVILVLPSLDAAATQAIIDDAHSLLLLYEGERPVKVYPLGGGTKLSLGEKRDLEVSVREADRAELDKALAGRPARRLGAKEKAPAGDRDADGIPDPLDVFLGAKKVALNGAAYVGGYVSIAYPNGDVPRDQGVCTDVIVRALRNAGIDLQKALHDDIAAAPRSYPMVKKSDSNIDHRRVKTILPWFKRKWTSLGTDPASTSDPFRPGDVVFMDTFPSRSGPDHIGIVSDTIGESGLPLVINNWTDGSVESEMDLLGFVPVTHRFRVK
jgi:uncharacterized protein YijF (DUF1287 family)